MSRSQYVQRAARWRRRALALATGGLVAFGVAGLTVGTLSAAPASARPAVDQRSTGSVDQASDGDHEPPDPAPRARIQEKLDEMVEAGAPGVVARVTDESGTWTARSGVADLESDRPMPRNGSFRPASITKSLVATVVLQLVDEDRLELDDRVDELLPGVVRGGDRVTVRQLLRHTSGIPPYMTDPIFEDLSYIHRHFTPTELVDIANQHDPTGEPGEAWSYSNTNYIVLGMIIEDATGKRLRDVLRERVLEPADMHDSYLAHRPGVPRGPHAKGYLLPAEGPVAEFTRLDPSFAWAAYGLVSTPADIERFYRSLWAGELLSDEGLDRMTNTVETGHPYFPVYGMGLESVQLTCSEPGFGHTGSILGYSSFAFSSANQERSVVISINAKIEGAQAGPIIFAGLNAINLEFCGEELPPPSSGVALFDEAR